MNCGCKPPSYNIEEIYEHIIVPKLTVEIPLPPSNLECLKEKVKSDYNIILNLLECGIQPNIENILEEISLLDSFGESFDVKNFIREYGNHSEDDPDQYYSCFSRGYWINDAPWDDSLEWRNN